MSFFRLPLASLLLAAPFAALAQRPTLPLPRLYVGLAAYTSAFQPIGNSAQMGFSVPVQATLGYQLRPRLAVQAEVSYQGQRYGYYYAGPAGATVTNGQLRLGPIRQTTANSERRAVAASLLARYTLTRQPLRRLQLDLLGGLSLEHYHAVTHGVTTDSVATPVSTFDYDNIDTSLLLSGGAGGRYRLGPRLEATGTVLVGVPLTGYGGLRNFEFRFKPSFALGLRYSLGRF